MLLQHAIEGSLNDYSGVFLMSLPLVPELCGVTISLYSLVHGGLGRLVRKVLSSSLDSMPTAE